MYLFTDIQQYVFIYNHIHFPQTVLALKGVLIYFFYNNYFENHDFPGVGLA